MQKRIKVIEVTQNGKVGYLKGTHCLDVGAVVSNPMDAINFLQEPKSNFMRERGGPMYDPTLAIKQAMDNLYLAGDAYYAKSGVRVDSINVVEFEISISKIDSVPGREPYKAK